MEKLLENAEQKHMNNQHSQRMNNPYPNEQTTYPVYEGSFFKMLMQTLLQSAE